jgi:hypothetical protein
MERGYEHFTTSAWYRSVRFVAARADPRDYQRFRPIAEVLRNDTLPVPSHWWRLPLRARGRLESAFAQTDRGTH